MSATVCCLMFSCGHLFVIVVGAFVCRSCCLLFAYQKKGIHVIKCCFLWFYLDVGCVLVFGGFSLCVRICLKLIVVHFVALLIKLVPGVSYFFVRFLCNPSDACEGCSLEC